MGKRDLEASMGEVVPLIKGQDCTDHDPIEEWVPESDEVYYFLTLHIGPAGEEGADLWDVLVCTPSGLSAAKQAGWPIGPTPPIVLRQYSWAAVLEVARERVAECVGISWFEVQENLRRRFDWEYESRGRRR